MNGIVRAKYDAFLSFHGPDTRDGFTDHLYESMTAAGIRVFKDDEGIRHGEYIRGEIERAILESRIYIVVLSRNYASSAWCLRELAMILDRCDDPASTKIILPIFYAVDPDDVKLRTEMYRKDLVKHEERHGHGIVRKWEEALVNVGQISSWDLKNIQGLIIQDILGKLKIRDRSLPEHLTGIDDRVDEMMESLCLESPDVRVVMVQGMGGIGKTALASVVFNRISSQFEGCSFLSNVRESSTNKRGVIKLQKKLLTDILGKQHIKVFDSSDGFNEIQRRLRGRSALIVLDDVDERDQLREFAGNCDWFGPGSRIVITTRDRSIGHGLMNAKAVYAFEMKEMNDDHALQLFSRHAFGGDQVPDDYVVLSKQVVRTTGNLPLALEVIGGHLSCESKEVWEGVLEKLKRVPDKKVMKILLVSYNGLDDREKQIFLDIACFSGEMSKRNASYMWEACEFYPKCGLAILVNKSLVKILPDDEFWMHDQLRDMGRDIVRAEGFSRFGYCSRLWVPEDALQVIHRKEGTDNILGVNLGVLPEGKSFTCEEFRSMSNLRYLQTNGGRFTGDFENFQTKLLWLSWDNCPTVLQPTFFHMNKLVILRISGPGITDDSVGKLMLGNLRVLQIHHALMTATPDFSWCLKLEIIILEDCSRLKRVHGSIGKLGNLATLKIRWCASLIGLPEELGRSKALQELFVEYCGTDQRRFDLPESINVLASLKILHVYYCPIREVPNSSVKLKSLEYLSLKGCNIKSLPEPFFGLKSLIEMDLSNNEIEELPESIGMLESLLVLRVRNTKIRKLPSMIGNLSRLVELDAACCPLNEGIPEQFGALSALVRLNFKNSELCELPACISRLSSLRSLGLENCRWLQELPELPTSLKKLKFTSESLQRLPDLSQLKNLRNLQLCDSYASSSFFRGKVADGTRSDRKPIQLSWIGNLQNLQILHLHFTSVSVILPTNLSSLSRLKKLDLSCPDRKSLLWFPSCLSRLSISYFRTTILWTQYSNLRLLHSPELHHSPLMEIQLEGLEVLENLKVLRIADCEKLVRLPSLSGLTRLSSLKLEACPMMVEIPGLGQMEMLEHLAVLSCESIASIPDLRELSRMRAVGIIFCDSLNSIPRMISDCSLHILDCRRLYDFCGPYWQYQPRRRRTPGLIRGGFATVHRD